MQAEMVGSNTEAMAELTPNDMTLTCTSVYLSAGWTGSVTSSLYCHGHWSGRQGESIAYTASQSPEAAVLRVVAEQRRAAN